MSNQALTLEQLLNNLHQLSDNDTLVPLRIFDGSMTPFLQKARDVAYLRGVKFQEPKVGDIILFERTNHSKWILHRILKILPDGTYVVNGDAQSWCEIVKPDQMYAVVSEISIDGKEPISVDARYRKFLRAIWRPVRVIRPLIFSIVNRFRNNSAHHPNAHW